MSSEFVTVATYQHQSRADVARLALANAGIESFIQDACTGTMDWFLGNAIGWIKLQVANSRAAEARALLEATPGLLWEAHPAGQAISDDACLACGQVIPPGKDRCPACGWSFLDQPVEEAE